MNTKNIFMGEVSIFWRLGRSHHVFGDGGGIGIVIGRDHREGLDTMAEVSILNI